MADKVSFLTLALADKHISDAVAHIAEFNWLGVTTTALTDGATTNPITINDESVTAVANDKTKYNSTEFVFNGEIWQEYSEKVTVSDGVLTFA